MNGAWNAAIKLRTKFNKMNGAGSNGCFESELNVIHPASISEKQKMNRHEPTKYVTESLIFCDVVRSSRFISPPIPNSVVREPQHL